MVISKETQKNGLTAKQVSSARGILKQVNVAAICNKYGINVSTIYNVLRDESPHIDKLKVVLDDAKKQIEKRKRTLSALPE